MKKNIFKFSELNLGLAYLIGVYLGDGCVDKIYTNRSKNSPSYYFKLGSIDKDFVERVRNICEVIITNNTQPIRESQYMKNKLVYRYTLGCSDFCKWLLEICEGKNKIPDIIPRKNSIITKSFLEGIIDSEGYVSLQKKDENNKKKNDWLMSGFSISSSWTHEVADLLLLQGVKLGKCTKYLSKSNTIMYSYRFNIRSYYESGLKFNLKRKHNKVLQYFSENPQRLPNE